MPVHASGSSQSPSEENIATSQCTWQTREAVKVNCGCDVLPAFVDILCREVLLWGDINGGDAWGLSKGRRVGHDIRTATRCSGPEGHRTMSFVSFVRRVQTPLSPQIASGNRFYCATCGAKRGASGSVELKTSHAWQSTGVSVLQVVCESCELTPKRDQPSARF